MPILKINVTTAATLVQASQDRKWSILQNLSDTDIYVALDGSSDVTGAAGAKPGIKLSAQGGIAAGGEGEFNINFSGPIYAIHEGTGSKVLTLQYV